MEDRYAPHAVWNAPERGIVWRGIEQVLAGLAREAAAMQAARLIRTQCAGREPLLLKAIVKQFEYRGGEIERIALPHGSTVQLQRLRVLTCIDSQVIAETCFETWSVLAQPGEF